MARRAGTTKRRAAQLSWFRKKPIGERPLTESEVEAYNKGHNDGVSVILEQLTDLDPDAMGPEGKALIKRLILAHAVETAGYDK